MAFRRGDEIMPGDASGVWRVLRYAFYDWKGEMPRSRRLLVSAGLFLQVYALYAMWTRSLVWPILWPHAPFLVGSVWLLYLLGYCLTSVTLTAEFLRKTQLESDQIAARQIQQTLHPQQVDAVPGYQIEMVYDPMREVGGDYFDVIPLADGRTLLAIADVSGKGMPAALLAANLQALIRTISRMQPDPAVLAREINEHLSRYTPSDRFATAVFAVLDQGSGAVTYVNAGHNAPMLVAPGAGASLMEATGLPLGLFARSSYEVRSHVIPPGGRLLLFTDGLTDSIAADDPNESLRGALAGDADGTMARLKSLVDPQRQEDDVTILLVKRK